MTAKKATTELAPLITIRELAGDGPNRFSASIHAENVGLQAPTLAGTVRHLLEHLTAEISTSEDGTCFSWRDECQAAWKERKEACEYLERLLMSLLRQHMPENTVTEPLCGDLLGLITQLDNLTTAWRETDAELDALKERYRWIPVGERLPEKGKVVLAKNPMTDPFVASRYGHGWFNRDTGRLCAVTHWREIDSPEVQG